jgi:hypothetical protein
MSREHAGEAQCKNAVKTLDLSNEFFLSKTETAVRKQNKTEIHGEMYVLALDIHDTKTQTFFPLGTTVCFSLVGRTSVVWCASGMRDQGSGTSYELSVSTNTKC